MAGPKKFGTFAGVFTPSILTILGVIMYLRMGWVVGNSGVITVLIIIGLAHVISVSTGLSISSIATDKKVGAGGVYYVLSRSLGLPIGGALGLALFAATAFSIALYMVGFAEIFNEYISFGDFGVNGEFINDPNNIRITASLGLLILTVIAFISTSIALKTQFFILAVIVLSLFSIFLGDPANVTVFEVADGVETPRAGFAAIFAIFFPAVTGFTAGVAMSGDLKDPKKSIPVGTMGSIAVGLIIYTVLALFLAYSLDPETLINNPKAIVEMAAIGLLVYIGVWGATLSSALGGILGGPRILQAMSIDKITPKIFAKGVGKDNEPRNALILTVIIAEVGILIGDLNVIAEIVSMFYLAAYGFINISFFLESWASADFKPTFKVRKWIGLLGFIATFAIMSQLNMMAMIAAFIIIGGIYFYLSRKQISLGTGDIWQSVWSTIVKKGLKRMEEGTDHKRNWKPNMLLFSGLTEYRSQMIEFSKAISGQYGIVTNFDLDENPEATVLFPKNKQSVDDDELEKYGIFGRKLEVQNAFKGIESIACTFGFSGVEPNTVLMAWPGETKDVKWFTSMTQKLMDLDYNILYLDYDKRWGFRKKQSIDLWWRGMGSDAELMLMIAKFIANSPEWSQAQIRILVVNDTNVNHQLIETRINNLLDLFRVRAAIKILNNEVDKKPLYELMKTYSQDADLVIAGVPEIAENEAGRFVSNTNELVGTIGTTLLVRASSQFDEADLSFEKIQLGETDTEDLQKGVIPLEFDIENELSQRFHKLDTDLETAASELLNNGVDPLQSFHHDLLARVTKRIDESLDQASKFESKEKVLEFLSAELFELNEFYTNRIIHQLEEVCQLFATAMDSYIFSKENLIHNVERKIKLQSTIDQDGNLVPVKQKVRYKNAMHRVWLSEGITEAYDEFLKLGYNSFLIIHQSKNILHRTIWDLLHENWDDDIAQKLSQEKSIFEQALEEIDKNTLQLSKSFYISLRNKERENIRELVNLLSQKGYQRKIEERFPLMSNKKIEEGRQNISNFPAHLFRNSIFFTYHLQADLSLLAFSMQTSQLFIDLEHQWKRDLEDTLIKEFDIAQQYTNDLIALVNQNKSKEIGAYQIERQAELIIDFSKDINELTKSAIQNLKPIPEAIELISASSLNEIREIQNESVATEEVKLNDISEFLFQTKLLEPLNTQLKNYESQIRRHYNLLLSQMATLQKNLNDFVLSQDAESLSPILNEMSNTLADGKEQMLGSLNGAYGELRIKREEIRQEFDINNIIEQVEGLHAFVKENKGTQGIIKSLQKSVDFINASYSKAYDYVANQRKEKTSLEYVRKHSHLISEQDVIAGFMERIQPIELVPYSYRQIFGEGYYLDEKTFSIRQREVNMVQKGIARIEAGSKGAILVLGSAGSGKSAFTDFIANGIINNKPFYIAPGSVGSNGALLEAFKRGTSETGTIKQILNGLPEKSVFIFNDLEQWVVRSSNLYQNYSKLASIVKEFSQRHYFIFNANIHAYTLIRNNTDFASAIISTTILPQINQSELVEIIRQRHHDSGMRIEYEGTLEHFIKEGKLNKIIGSIVSPAKGNIGSALSLWLASIEGKVDNDLVIQKKAGIEFPFIKDIELQNLIYHLFIFKSINKKDLVKVYGPEYQMWIDRWVEALLNVNLLEWNKNGNLEIASVARPFIEKWLNELGYTA
ncbi:MAG: hypothetical protein MK078_08635 [Crocinitomicaceae bacterium]|nr:hypothetical protein [Crocinitomicaceae bacterium]